MNAMRSANDLIDAVLDDAELTLDDLCRRAAVPPDWVQHRVAEGLLPRPGGRFDVHVLQRVQVMRRMEQHFDAVPELAALVADLEEEIQRLRRRLVRLGDR